MSVTVGKFQLLFFWFCHFRCCRFICFCWLEKKQHRYNSQLIITCCKVKDYSNFLSQYHFCSLSKKRKMCHGVPYMKTETIVGWIVLFFMATSFWITVIVPDSYTVAHDTRAHATRPTSINPHLDLDQTKKLAIFCLERSGSTW